MDAFAPILGMTMIVIGLLMLLGCFGGLMWILWRRATQEAPPTPPAAPASSDVQPGNTAQ